MDWKDVAGSVSKAAPLVGTLLGGPIGGAIGGLIPLLAHAFGLTPEETTADKINSLLASDPQAAVKLAEIEANNKLQLQELVIKAMGMELQDIQSARARQVEVTKATGRVDINLYVLAWVIMGGFLGLIGCLIVLQVMYKFVLQADPLVTLLLGSLSTDAGMVVGYFFGSSRGSAQKSIALEEALQAKR